VLFIFAVIALQLLHLQGSLELHTIMKVVATLLATFAGILALDLCEGLRIAFPTLSTEV